MARRKKKTRFTDTCLGRVINLVLIIVVAVVLFQMARSGQLGDYLNIGIYIPDEASEQVNGGVEDKGKDSGKADKGGGTTESITGGIRFDFIDAGQSDSTLITTPNGKRILIDTGMSAATSDILSFLEDSKVQKIDYMILTHPHSDHIGGAAEILTIYDVKNIIMPNVTNSGSTFEKLIAKIENERKDGCKVYSAEVGDTYPLDGCEINIYGPVEIDERELNNTSIVMTLKYRDFTALFSGDAEAEAEKLVLENGADIDCDLMKIPHHGSSSSSTKEFLDAATPKIGIISCGKNNSYGHPHTETIKALDDRDIEYYITSENGNISVFSDGKNYNVVTEK